MATHEVYVDCETTGLDPRLHWPTEIAWAVGDTQVGTLYPQHSLEHADPKALDIHEYWFRDLDRMQGRGDVRLLVHDLTGATLVAANAAFDAAMLTKVIGYAPWHYRLLDVEAYGAGVLGLDHVAGLRELTEVVRERGHEVPDPDHTAAADVRTLRAVHQALRAIRREGDRG